MVNAALISRRDGRSQGGAHGCAPLQLRPIRTQLRPISLEEPVGAVVEVGRLEASYICCNIVVCAE